MKAMKKIITSILCVIILCLYFFIGNNKQENDNIKRIYAVYLDGTYLGAIDDKDALYSLIDNKQELIKQKYDVLNVYPPNGLNIIEKYSFNDEVSSINNIYNKIEELQDFTINGYEIKVSGTDSHSDYTIYVLDKDIFKEAVNKFVLAFIDENDYNNYIKNEQGTLEDNRKIYSDLKLLENISIREKYISVNEKIYSDADSLVQDLLFGFDYSIKKYTVKAGDNIETISNDNELNTKEFLIANQKYSNVDSLLKIGDVVNIVYVKPRLTFEYTLTEMNQVEYAYDKTIVRDNTKPSNYSEITTPGVTGISMITSYYNVSNGEASSEAKIKRQEEIRAKVDQVTTKGKLNSSNYWQVFEETGSGWTWPTESPYVITSTFGYRYLGGGTMHNGIDISGTGFGSRIYAANDGVVSEINTSCPNNGYYGNKCGGSYGNYVIIDHGNDVHTIYAHLTQNVIVSVGQKISKKQVIAYMGNSGSSTGTHLHFGLSIGNPHVNANLKNPLKELYK